MRDCCLRLDKLSVAGLNSPPTEESRFSSIRRFDRSEIFSKDYLTDTINLIKITHKRGLPQNINLLCLTGVHSVAGVFLTPVIIPLSIRSRTAMKAKPVTPPEKACQKQNSLLIIGILRMNVPR